MRYPASEKLEIIRIVEQSHLPAKRTLDLICPLQSGPSTILVWTLKEKTNGQETRA
jgi:hypothetical protein